jgi:hypothetical protein
MSFFEDLEKNAMKDDAPVVAEPTEVETLYEAEPMTPSAPVTHEEIEENEQEEDSVPALVSEDSPKEEVVPTKTGSSTGLGWFLLLAVIAFGGVFVRLAMTSASPSSGDSELPAGAEVAPGEGMLEITAPAEELSIDGVVRGRGPHLVVTLQAGAHELKYGATTKNVTIVQGRLNRIDVSSP